MIAGIVAGCVCFGTIIWAICVMAKEGSEYYDDNTNQ